MTDTNKLPMIKLSILTKLIVMPKLIRPDQLSQPKVALVGDQIWPRGPLLATKIGPGLLLAGRTSFSPDQFWHDSYCWEECLYL